LIPDPPSSKNKGAKASETSLEAGLAALKKSDYPRAIAILENVCQFELSENIVLRAQMGLVAAYERAGEVERALALCQTLAQSSNPKVKQWGDRTLADIAKRYPGGLANSVNSASPPASDVTGFVPIDQKQPPNQISAAGSDVTGFVSLDQTPANRTRSPASENTGFAPINQTSQAGKTREKSPRPPSSVPPQGGRSSIPVPPPDKKSNRAEKPEKNLIKAEEDNFSASTEELPTTEELAETEELVNIQHSTLASWRQAGRASSWRPMKPIKLRRLWMVQAGTAIALFWLINNIIHLALNSIYGILPSLPFGQQIISFYNAPTLPLSIFLLVLLCASPWLIDALLKLFYPQISSLSLPVLAKHSPEAAKVLPRVCRQHRVSMPTLKVLPTDAPVALSYGNLPRNARIVVSQGLLQQLTDDEIATIYAGELGHIVQHKPIGLAIAAVVYLIGALLTLAGNLDLAGYCWWIGIACLPVGFNLALISLIVVIIQIPYSAYWQVAQWANGIKFKIKTEKLQVFTLFVYRAELYAAGIVAALSYGLYWLLRWPGLWFSRARIYYSDRIAAETTGNPNGFTRALLKIAIGTSADVKEQRLTSWLLQGFDLVAPVGYRQAIALGSFYPQKPFEELLAWDCINPYRNWLVTTYSHPLTGDRLQLLSRYAQFWQLETELDLQPSAPFPRTLPAKAEKVLGSHKGLPLLQSALFFGLLIAIALRLLFWILGGIGNLLNIWQLIWMFGSSTLFAGCLLVGFSLSIFMHINAYFPDIKPDNLLKQPSLPDLVANPTLMVADSLPVALTGKLLGRPGCLNWLGQDLILETPKGLVKLHFYSFLGPFGNLWARAARPSDFIDRQVTVTGWFRRGATAWIDLETISAPGGVNITAKFPIWVTALACASAVWGAWIIWQASA
jgi:Zn-dependent protease with chaperone function